LFGASSSSRFRREFAFEIDGRQEDDGDHAEEEEEEDQKRRRKKTTPFSLLKTILT